MKTENKITNPQLNTSSSPESKIQNQKSKINSCALRRAAGVWDLTFNGHHAILKHEQGLSYLAYLLAHPNQPIHALDLATRITAASARHRHALTEMIHPTTGQRTTLDLNARLQERAPSLDTSRVMRAVLRRQRQLEALVEDSLQIEPVIQEAYRELIALYDYEKDNSPRVRDAAAKASDAVGRALKRLVQHLKSATSPDGTPNQLLAHFAAYIHKHILIPSGRTGVHHRPGHDRAGLFTYEPPPGVRWTAQA